MVLIIVLPRRNVLTIQRICAFRLHGAGQIIRLYSLFHASGSISNDLDFEWHLSPFSMTC